MAVWYLDNDDEITDAVARLRSATDERVIFVVPVGSRIATGRINFKLLAREASTRDIAMAVASPDEQVRSLATSAGVLARSTADEAEAALERGEVAPEPVESGAGETGAEASGIATAELPAGRPRGRRLAVGVGLVLGVVLVGGIASLEVLPTAEITLRPRTGTVGPFEVAVTASALVDVVDAASGTIPARTITIPLEVEGVFAASGSESIEQRASGGVVFSSAQQSFEQIIEAGTRVSTPAGIEFSTTEAVSLRPVEDGGATEVAAPIEALQAGPEGNVAAGTISVAPSLQGGGVSVSNSAATSGGIREETAVVTARDYDAAAVDLQNRLAGELAARLRDPDQVPAGLTLFAETAQLGPVRHEPDANDVVGRTAAEFELGSSAVASALAVDTDLVAEVASAELSGQLAAGTVLTPASVRIDVGEGTPHGRQIEFSGTASADTHVVVDAGSVLDQIAGLPVSEAQAILDRFGTATVTVWPDFLGDLPNDRNRISLDVTEPSTTE